MRPAALALAALLATASGCARPAGSAGGASAPAPPPSDGSGAVELETLVAGRSGVQLGERTEHRLTDDAAWRAWLDRVGHAEAPGVDFGRRLVLAVDGEDAANGCHAVRIVRVSRLDERRVRAEVQRFVPPPDRACTMMMVRPYHAVALPFEGAVPEVEFTWSTRVGDPAP